MDRNVLAPDNGFNDECSGFRTLYNPPTGDDPQLDIIAIHGEGGHWDGSWTLRSSGYNWLKDAIPRVFPYARVAVYHYTRGSNVRESLVNNLLLDLRDYRTSPNRLNVPIVFIAHSFGGTLVKQLYVATFSERNSQSRMAELHACIRGFAFFGTYHSGGEVPERIKEMLVSTRRIIFLIPGASGYADRAKTLIRLFDQLPLINEDFKAVGGDQVPTVCFYELKKTKISPMKDIEIVPREQSILPSAIESRGLETNHADLVRFASANDQSLARVLGSMRQLIDNALTWNGVSSTNATDNLSVDGDVNILSLDGGGVKGLFSIIVLETLMEAVRRIDAPEVPDALKPCDYFSLICGTSTGGLLAIMLGRLRMDLRSCKQAYKSLSKEIFRTGTWKLPGKKWWDAFWNKSWYSGDALESAIKRILEEHISELEKENLQTENIPLAKAPLRPQAVLPTRCFVCATVKDQTRAERIRSYIPFSNEVSHLTICQASRATSAAPLYFPPINVAGKEYYDGGMASNNPIIEAVREATTEFQGHNISAIVSIGTGASKIVAPNRGLQSVIDHMVARVTDTEEKWEEFLALFPLHENVSFRFQEKGNLGSIDLASSDRLEEVEKLAKAYVASPEVRVKIDECARKLANNGT